MIDQNRLLREFFTLVQIDSETKQERSLANYLKTKLQRLGLQVKEDQTQHLTGCRAGNLLCTLPGTKKGVPALYFSAHMDTVSPGTGVKPRVVDGVITSDGSTILGADDKAGLAAMVEAVHVLLENNLEHGDIQFIMTVGEEAGFTGAKALEVKEIKAGFGYVLDYEGTVGTIVTAAPALARLKFVICGNRTATKDHAKKKRSAVQLATKAIRALGRMDGETEAEIVSFTGGEDWIELVYQIRSMKDEKLKTQIKHLETVFTKTAELYGGRSQVFVESLCPALELDDHHIAVEIAKQAVYKIGRAPRLVTSRDGSDANIFCARGLPAVNLGCGYEKIHTTEENIAVEELYKLAELILTIMTIDTGFCED